MRFLLFVIGVVAAAAYATYENVKNNVKVKSTDYETSNNNIVVKMTIKNSSWIPIYVKDVHGVLKSKSKPGEGITSSNKEDLFIKKGGSSRLSFLFGMATAKEIIKEIFTVGDIEGYYIEVYFTVLGMKVKLNDYSLEDL